MPVPEAYYQFVMDYAPYLYITPQIGPDLTWGKAALAGGFAVDFLYEAYFDPQFDDRSEVHPFGQEPKYMSPYRTKA